MQNTLTYLDVEMHTYVYLPKKQIPKTLSGLYTRNVCECVAGFILSDQGFGFFHFSKSNDATRLAQKINRDFKDNTKVKLVFLGGNLSFLFPWKKQNRNLVFGNLTGNKALDKFRKEVIDSKCVWSPFLGFEDEEGELKILENYRIPSKYMDFYTYNTQKINEALKEKQFRASLFSKENQFTVQGVKDYLGYQNLARITHSIANETKLFHKQNTEHYNFDAGKDLLVGFDGSLGVLSDLSEDLDIVDKIEGINSESLRSSTPSSSVGLKSIDKQNILNSYTLKST